MRLVTVNFNLPKMSKRVWNPPVTPQGGDTTTAWRSVGEKEGSQSFREILEREFPQGDSLSEEEQKRRECADCFRESSGYAERELIE